MTGLETAVAMARVQAVLANEMTAAQRARAASALRELEGSERERKFFDQAAKSLEEFSAGLAAEQQDADGGAAGAHD